MIFDDDMDDFDFADALLAAADYLYRESPIRLRVRRSKTREGFYGTLRVGGELGSYTRETRGRLMKKARGATENEVYARLYAAVMVRVLKRQLGRRAEVSITWRPATPSTPASTKH